MRRIKILDTTLRDGEQAPGCGMNRGEKLEVAQRLEALGVDVIEAGFAASSREDFNSVSEISAAVKSCTVASLARALEKDIDAAYDSVKNAADPMIHIFLATSPIHMEHKLKASPDEVLERIGASVTYARAKCPNVEFSAEDATRSDRGFLVRAVRTALSAGADTINIPDTVGYSLPSEMGSLIAFLLENVPQLSEKTLSVHCHNDLGMAVANSLSGVLAGASQVECAVNGLGERAGNAALEEIAMAIKTRGLLFDAETGIDTAQINRTSRLVYSTIGQAAPINKPVVGINAFLHEAGIHQHGVLANPLTYEIMKPEDIGIVKGAVVLGRHSGKHALAERLGELGYHLSDSEISVFYERFMKVAEKKRFIGDSDLEALMKNGKKADTGLFRLENFTVQTSKNTSSTCVVTLSRSSERFEEVALGDGPVNAAYNAIDRITGHIVEETGNYAIHSVTDGADALGEVTVRMRSGDRTVTGRGLSTDIIESSILAYINGLNKLIELLS